MAAFNYRVENEVFELFPGYELGVLIFNGLCNSSREPALEALLREAEEGARKAVTGHVAELPEVAAWRNAYRRFGAKPAEHRSSIEAMLRRVSKPDQLPAINSLVDIGNIVSLRHMLPAGVHPLREFEAPVVLRLAHMGDTFLPQDAGPPEMVPEGEVVLATGTDVLTRRWTWRQAAMTRILPDTQQVFFNVDGLPPTSGERIESAMRDIEELVARFCGGELVAKSVLTRISPCISVGRAAA